MEDPTKTADSVTIPDIARLPHRQFVPDVPEDVEDEIALHLNDPNWDFQANSSTFSIVSDGVQPKRRSRTASHVTKIEADTESEASAWHIHDARDDFSSEGKQVQWVSFSSSSLPCVLYPLCSIRDSPYPEVRAAVGNTDDPTMVVNTFRV